MKFSANPFTMAALALVAAAAYLGCANNSGLDLPDSGPNLPDSSPPKVDAPLDAVKSDKPVAPDAPTDTPNYDSKPDAPTAKDLPTRDAPPDRPADSSKTDVRFVDGMACGNLDQPCCAFGEGARCGGGSICTDNTCVACGGENQRCCGNQNCAPSELVCVEGGPNDRYRLCLRCGGLDQPCCAGNGCEAGAS